MLDTSLSEDRSDLELESWMRRSKQATADCRLLVLSLRRARTDDAARHRDDELPLLLLSSWDEPDDDVDLVEDVEGDDLLVEARRRFVTGSSSSLSLLQRLDDNCKKTERQRLRTVYDDDYGD